MTIDQAGRRRIAELVRASMGWTGISGPAIEQTGRVSRATVDRVKRGDENVSDTMLRALGDVLGMPRDFLLYVGTGNVRAIRASGGHDVDLVQWVLLNLFPPEDDPDPPGLGRIPDYYATDSDASASGDGHRSSSGARPRWRVTGLNSEE